MDFSVPLKSCWSQVRKVSLPVRGRAPGVGGGREE